MKTLASLLVLTAFAALPASGGEASGQFVHAKRDPIKPKYAAAFEGRDLRDARKRIVEVVLSETPVDMAAAVNDLDPHTSLINQPALMDHNYIFIVVRGRDDVSYNATYGMKMAQFVDFTPGTLHADIPTLTADKVAGRVWSTKPAGDDGYTIDVKFSADIAHPPAGTKLPAGGGEPGKAFMAYYKVLQSGNVAGVKKAVSAERAKEMDDPDFAKMFPLVQALEPKNVKITGGALDGNSATLFATAHDEHEDSTGTIHMVKENGAWKVEKEEWKSHSH